MSVYITGDIHGNPFERFSFSQNPELKDLTNEDFMFILGDFGLIWDKDKTAQEKYALEWLHDKPWTTIAIMGNHENWYRVLALPQVEKFGGIVRDTGYSNIWIVADPTILDICGKHILIMPGADSHDIYKVHEDGDWFHLGTGYSNLVDPAKDADGRKRKMMKEQNFYYRVIGESWWPQESINIDTCLDLLEGRADEYFDLVLTHDCPSTISNWYTGFFGKIQSTEGERFFDMVAKFYAFGSWYHGHHHFDSDWPEIDSVPYSKKITGLYHHMVRLDD